MLLKGLAAIVGGFLIQLTLGSFYTIGNLSPYIMSYLKNRAGFSVSYSQTIWISALSAVGEGSFMFLGGLLENKLGTRLTCLLGGIISCTSVAVTGLLIPFGFIFVALVFGLLASTGVGITYATTLATAMRWFPGHKGLVNGITLSAFGIGALVFNPIQTAFLNPLNDEPAKDGFFYQDEVLEKVPKVFYLMSGIYGVINIIGIIILFQPSPTIENPLVKSKESVPTTNLNTIENDHKTEKELKQSSSLSGIKAMGPLEMLKHKEFYMLWWTFFFIIQCIQFISSYYKIYGQTFIHDDWFLTIVGSIASICNGLGRILWGTIQDKTSYKVTTMAITLILTALMMSFIITPTGGKITFIIWVLLSYLTFSGTVSIMPTATSLCFGSKYVATNIGLLFTAATVSSILAAVVIQQMLNYAGWMGTFILIGCFTLVAFVITIFMPYNLESVGEKVSILEHEQESTNVIMIKIIPKKEKNML